MREPRNPTAGSGARGLATGPTALRGLGSSGVAARAIAHSGQAAVDEGHAKALAPFETPSGAFEAAAVFRYLICTR